VLLVAPVAATFYPICTVVEAEPGVYPDVTCYDALAYRGRRFCSDKAGANPGGIFTDFDNTFRYVLLTDQCPPEFLEQPGGWCGPPYQVTGRADAKEVARNEAEEAVATGLIRKAWLPFMDGMEPLDQFNPSSCVFSFTPAPSQAGE
jgi:hypothetical protein